MKYDTLYDIMIHEVMAMKIINGTVAKTPIDVGDVIINDLFGSQIIATQERK